jgi:hypothetical protein
MLLRSETHVSEEVFASDDADDSALMWIADTQVTEALATEYV